MGGAEPPPGGCRAPRAPRRNRRKFRPSRVGQADAVIDHLRPFADFAGPHGIGGIDAADFRLQILFEPDPAGAVDHAHELAAAAQLAHYRQAERPGAKHHVQFAHSARMVTRLSFSRAAPSVLRNGRPNGAAWISNTSPTRVSIFFMKLPVAAPKKCTCMSPGWRKSRYLK